MALLQLPKNQNANHKLLQLGIQLVEILQKEEIDDDNNDEDDRFVVNDQLKAAVEKAVPVATIIETEIDDYYSGGIEYEVDFYLNIDMEIIATIVNDRKY